MKPDDRGAFASALAVVAEMFREELSKLRIEGYFAALEDHDLEAVQSALVVAAKTLRFFPKSAELIEFIIGSIEDLATEAWERALRCCRRIEPDLVSLDPVTRMAVQIMGGIEEIDALTYVGVTSVQRAVARKNFLQAYAVALKRSDSRWQLESGHMPELTP